MYICLLLFSDAQAGGKRAPSREPMSRESERQMKTNNKCTEYTHKRLNMYTHNYIYLCAASKSN